MENYLIFDKKGFADYVHWQTENRKMSARINDLLKSIQREDSLGSGIGKAEILKGDYKGFCSRRIDKEHRLIYKVSSESNKKTTLIISCYDHYPKANTQANKEELLRGIHI